MDRGGVALHSPKIQAALDRAVDRGEAAELFELLERHSGLPGARPNLELARAVGAALAGRGRRADAVVDALCASAREYPRIVGGHALAARAAAGVGFGAEGAVRRPGAPKVDPAAGMATLQELAEDPRHLVRGGLVDALRVVIAARGDAAVALLASWTDGYLQAHVALEALADRTLLAALSAGGEVTARLDEAFALADVSPRSAERLQGVRLLRQGLPAQIAAFAARFPEVVAWLEGRAAATRPETREVVAQAIAALRRASFSDAEAARLSAALAASAPPPRDPSRIVQGTRKRGKGRR